jgi:predicted metal-binding protein
MTAKRTLEEYCRAALARGASWARAVPASYVVTAPWVGYKCRFGCGSYGARHLCPPATPTPAETAAVIRCYARAILVTYESGPRGAERALRKKMHEDLLALEREIFLDGCHKAMAFAAGPCNLCAKCDISKPCLRPGEPRPSMESCGIDVFSTFARAGVELEVVADVGMPYKLCGLVLVE